MGIVKSGGTGRGYGRKERLRCGKETFKLHGLDGWIYMRKSSNSLLRFGSWFGLMFLSKLRLDSNQTVAGCTFQWSASQFGQR